MYTRRPQSSPSSWLMTGGRGTRERRRGRRLSKQLKGLKRSATFRRARGGSREGRRGPITPEAPPVYTMLPDVFVTAAETDEEKRFLRCAHGRLELHAAQAFSPLPPTVCECVKLV